MEVRGGLHGAPWRSVEVSMEADGASSDPDGDLHGPPRTSMDLHGVPDNVGRRCTNRVIF